MNTSVKVYTDISCYSKTKYTTGIQRVVREVLHRMQKKTDLQIVFLNYSQNKKEVEVMNPDNLSPDSGEVLDWGTLTEKDVFFEIDACWNVAPRRSILYQELKKKNVKIITYIQDILPITHPEYFGKLGNWDFLGYIVACITYADRIVVTTEATRNSFENLLKEINCSDVDIDVVGLGGDLEGRSVSASEKIDRDAAEFVRKYDGKYVLMTGTIEPRKNHTVILDAFENELRSAGIPLVIAGRIGWNSEDTVSRIHKLEQGEHFVFLEGKNNATIRHLYEHAKIVVFPSFDEGYGLPIIEAMSYGVPVIAGDIPVLREVGGTACLYCDVHNAKEWGQTIRKLYSNDAEYLSWRKKAEKFSPMTWDETTEQLCGLIKQISIGRGGNMHV